MTVSSRISGAFKLPIRVSANELNMTSPIVALSAKHYRQTYLGKRLTASIAQRRFSQHYIFIVLPERTYNPAGSS
jgi:hypothetical protein